nr:S8 family peptidase [Metabacillus kandeliae]
MPLAKAETKDYSQRNWQKLVAVNKTTVKAAALKNEKKDPYDSKTLVIKYKEALPLGIYQKAGTKLVKRIPGLNYEIVQISGRQTLEKAAKVYLQTKGVLSVSRSALYYPQGQLDPKAGLQYQLKNLHIEEAQKLAGKNKVRVAVIDTGIDAKHPELINSVISNNSVTNPMQKGLPDVHGTHVAGIIAAKKDNGIGGYGINPNAGILSLDVFNRSMFTGDYEIALGILKAIDEKAQVINMSLSSSMSSPIIEEAVRKALKANITIVAAAGNSGMSDAEYPAAYEGVIGVGSVNSKNQLSSFSSYGPAVDVTAPGEEIYSTVYDYEKGSSFMKLSGTSMASPVVAGVASLLLSKNPKLTPYQVNYILNKTASDLGAKGYDLKYGHGLVNPVAALKFDSRKIPASLSISEGELLKKAKELKSDAAAGSFTSLNQHDAYRLEVHAGENIQTRLSGSKLFDYELDLRFFPKGTSKPTVSLNLNDQHEEKDEGTLFEAPGNGTLVLVAKDVYGNASESKGSSYTLTLNRSDQKMTDESSSFDDAKPLEAAGPSYFTDSSAADSISKGDKDYFTFKTEAVKQGERRVLSINGVTGINSKLVLWTRHQDDSGQYIDEPIEEADQNGISEGEELAFIPKPDTDYFLEVKNTPYFDPWGGTAGDLTRSFSSLLPYYVKAETKQIPDDEDGYSASSEGIPGQENGEAEVIASIALDYAEGQPQEGYLQDSDDEDWYKFTPAKSEILKFSFGSPNIPMADLMAYNENTGSFDFVTTNVLAAGTMPEFSAGLAGGKTYYLHLYDWEKTSLKPYHFQSKTVASNITDSYEPNDDFSIARPMKNSITATLSTSNDVDLFYFKPKDQGVYGLTMTPLSKPDSKFSKLPAQYLQPIDGVLIVIEDTNGNGVLEEEEQMKGLMTDSTFQNEPETASLDVQHGKGYFIGAVNYFPDPTLLPYKLEAVKLNQKDEDAGNQVKRNVPSKPAAMKKAGSGWKAAGLFNSSHSSKDDSDYYKLVLTKDSKLTLSLKTSFDTDGVLSLYEAKGKQLLRADQYGTNDSEVIKVNLKKGTYYIKVEEAHGRASVQPYEIAVQ